MPEYKEHVVRCYECKHKQVGPDRTKPGPDWYCAVVNREVNSNGTCEAAEAY